MRHKHADLIHAWAEGVEIEGKCRITGKWQTVMNADCITWSRDVEYRIKPEKKPDVVKFISAHPELNSCLQTHGQHSEDNLKLIYDGETGKLIKAEVL